MPSAFVLVTSTSLSSPDTAVVGLARKSQCFQALGKGKLLTSGDSRVRGEEGLMMEKKKKKKPRHKWELKNRKYD